LITGIHISSSEVIIKNEEKGKTGPLLSAKKDQIIDAKVLKVMSQGKIQLLVQGQNLVAKTSLLLTEGELLTLKVVQEKGALVLKLEGPLKPVTAQQLSSLVSLFAQKDRYLDLTKIDIAQFKKLIDSIALKSGKPDHGFLPKLLEKGGFLWETKVADLLLGKSLQTMEKDPGIMIKQDLKGTAMNLLNLSEVQSGGNLKTVFDFTETIEKFQILNHQNSESGRYLLPFPVFADESFSFGQLLIDKGDKQEKGGKKQQKVVNISLLLNMTKLGPLRADFSIFKKAISGIFKLSDQKASDYLRALIPELKKRLEKLEYKVQQISCKVAQKDEVDQASLVESLFKKNDDQVLNIVV